jgi:C4-dicarboxylate transporter DctM subunit
MGLILLLFVAFFIGIPIAFSLGLVSTYGIISMGAPITVVVQRMFSGVDSIPLIAVLLFTLAGSLMQRGGISDRLVGFSDVLVGHLPSGMAMVTIVSCMFFAAITGSAIAATAAIGGIMIPIMTEKGYDKSFSSSLMATGGSIGPIIPPSIPLLVYGVIANCSVAKLFLGGAIPGVGMGIALMILSYFVGKKRNYIGRDRRATAKEIIASGKEAVWALITPIIIMGGILSGVFTATESAAVAVAYSLLVGAFVYKELDFSKIKECLFEAAKTTGTVLIIVGFASLFTWVITMQLIPQKVAAYLSEAIHARWVMLLVMNIILLIVGTFIDTTSAIVIFAPLFLTLAKVFGIDVIHLGVIMAVNLTIGMCTPPLGVCLFVASGIAKIPLKAMFRDLWPQLIALTIVLFIITYIPATVTYIPNLLIK